MKIFTIFHVPEFMDALLYGNYRIQFKCKLCKRITFVMKIFIKFLLQSLWMPFFLIFIKFNLNVNCLKTITFVMKMFIIFLFQSSWIPSFRVFIDFNLYVNCVKAITLITKIFIIFHVPEFMDAFCYGIYRIQFKCKLCKDNNICYDNFHHISLPEFMDALFYGIYRLQIKCKLFKETINLL